jgi:prepilin-type N-terminal cleavage/methylation domain-containing protein
MRQKSRRQHRGFTLVELMIVVAVIAMIASLAIPNYLRFTARSARSEMQETVSKLKLYLKNVYDNQGTVATTSTLLFDDPISAFNPTAPVAIGQPAGWDVHAKGWTDFPFPPEGAIKMRYQYTITNVDEVVITVCGSLTGLGSLPNPCTPIFPTANYSYTEVFHANGSSEAPVEFPAF